MPRPRPEARALAERFRLRPPERPPAGHAGERLGRGTGSSLEFQDRRAYVPGDDVRHVDWRALARTGELVLKLYREEVQPRVDVVLDASRSMAQDAEKAQLACDLTALLLSAAEAEGYARALWIVGEELLPEQPAAFLQRGVELEGSLALSDVASELTGRLVPGSLRFVVSDFLFPQDPAPLMRAVAARAGAASLVQILSREDDAPEPGRALRLRDAETGQGLDLVLDRAAVERYGARLAALRDGLHRAARRAGVQCCTVVARQDLAGLCREVLVPAGLVAPA